MLVTQWYCIMLFTISGVDEDSIAAIRDASIVTSIEISEDDEVIRISTSDIDSEDAANTVTFTTGTATNITNPLNGEAVEVKSDKSNFQLSHQDLVCWDTLDLNNAEDPVNRPGDKHGGD